jgi:hypothetical protein
MEVERRRDNAQRRADRQQHAANKLGQLLEEIDEVLS